MKTLQIILYSFRRCPYAMRARMALNYAHIKYQHREIILKNKPKSMLNYSEKGTVPVLIVQNKIIDESLDVMMWALEQNDSNNWLNNNNQQQQHAMFELIQLCDEKFKAHLDRYKYSDRHDLSEVEYRAQSLWFLELLEQRLIKHTYLISNKTSLADIAIFPFIRQYAFVNKNWFDDSSYVHLQKWLDSWLKSDLFISIMHKYPLWEDI